jgi:hypothetical protein
MVDVIPAIDRYEHRLPRRKGADSPNYRKRYRDRKPPWRIPEHHTTELRIHMLVVVDLGDARAVGAVQRSNSSLCWRRNLNPCR